jgi:hypothetical protein
MPELCGTVGLYMWTSAVISLGDPNCIPVCVPIGKAIDILCLEVGWFIGS